MKIKGFELTKNRLIILVIVSIFVILFLNWFITKYEQQIITWLIIIMVIIAVALGGGRRFSSPEEELAYKKRRAELEAEQDFKYQSYPKYYGSPLAGPIARATFSPRRRRKF